MWKQSINNYINTFWATIREFQEKNPEYRVHIPQIYRFTYLFLSYKCIDGYLVVAYPSGFTDNYIYDEIEDSVSQRLAKLPNKIVGTDNPLVLGVDNFGGSGMYSGFGGTATLSNGTILPTTGYKFFYMATLVIGRKFLENSV